MKRKIEAIFLDLGNTLRFVVKDEVHMARAQKEIARLVGTDEDPVAFCAKLDERYKSYRQWALDTMKEAPEAELWTRWLVPEFPAERIASQAVELTYQYRQSSGRRVVKPNSKEVVIELHRRGYILGIISNLTASREIPDWMDADGFTPYFKSVVLSSVFGRRKPDPSIYLEAARIAGVSPADCVYVGDNLKRDVTGTRKAGFGMAVILLNPAKTEKEPITDENRPDVIIHEFDELLKIFPGGRQASYKTFTRSSLKEK